MADFVEDSFQKNDIIIDRCYKALVEKLEAEYGPDNFIDIQLCLYSKNLGNEKYYRMFVGVGDMNNKKVFLADATAKAIGVESFEIQDFKKIEPLAFNGIPNTMFPNYAADFPGNNQCEEFLVNPPVKQKFFIVRKEAGLISLCMTNDKNELEEYYTYRF